MRLEVEEFTAEGTCALFSHTRIIVVARAPAMFEVPCSERDCDGIHSLTRDLLRGLRASAENIEGEGECFGVRGNAPCRRRLHYRATARYAEPTD